ncbi:MAG: hypothetical protein J5643_07290 [Lachnospiraceae bacterium]|nr:hypothetical protein [Lachnospiraceae bacterium]
MKRGNQFRDLSAESLVNNLSGPLHAIVPDGVRKKRRSGPKPYENPEEAKICIECPYETCQLDIDDRWCERYEQEIKKLKEKQNG